MSHGEVFPGPVSVRWRAGEHHRDEVAADAIASVWAQERQRRPELRDEPLLSLEAWERKPSGGLAIQAVFRPYRSYLAHRRRPELDLGFAPLAISMVTVTGGMVVVGRRSDRVTTYPGRLEFVPSGGLDKDSARADGTVDYENQVLRELSEEAGEGFRVRSVVTVGLLHDLTEGAWDIVGLVQIDPPWRPRPTAEYPEVRLLTPAACAQSLAAEPADWVPTAPLLWGLAHSAKGSTWT